ncbi:hypothetical protein MAR_013633 [Mya arenaria]|uniref:Uncharacterized protein n=1 Tax=Mya arenaria TaxID=6604 RepID=A0ABY7G332_MYAAR|nr:hypothetical protein MAR_013633 [Mya arenaria]
MTSHSTSVKPNITPHKTTKPSHSTSISTPHSKSTMTSHPTQTKTTWNPTPSTTPFPTTPKYDLCNEMYCCVILKGNFRFTIPYEMENNKTNTLTIGVPNNAMVTGTCNLNNTNTTQEIDVDFFSGWKLSVVIKEGTANDEELQAGVDEGAGQFYSWERVSLEYVLDDHFVKPKGKGKNMTVMTVLTFDTFKTDTQGSFACDSEESLKLGEVDFLISKLQYRGFGITNSTDFPKADVKRCPQDLPKTTAKPCFWNLQLRKSISTNNYASDYAIDHASEHAPVYTIDHEFDHESDLASDHASCFNNAEDHYTNDDITFHFSDTLSHPLNDAVFNDPKTSTLMIGVPDNALVTGTCNLNNTNTAQEIDIDFFDSWKLSVVLVESTANGDELQAGEDEGAAQFYSWERVTLEYVLDDHFVKPKGKGENMTVMTVLTFDTFKTDTLGSFACDSEESLKLGEVDFFISKLQYRGFGHTQSTDFPKADVKRCSQDLSTTSAKPVTSTATVATTTAKPVTTTKKPKEETTERNTK